jgi:hypothetical protein
MLDAMLPITAKRVEAKAVLLRVDQLDELVPQLGPLGWVHRAFKNGILHALAAIQALLGYAPQTPPSFAIDRGYVVGYQDHHRWCSSLLGRFTNGDRHLARTIISLIAY